MEVQGGVEGGFYAISDDKNSSCQTLIYAQIDGAPAAANPPSEFAVRAFSVLPAYSSCASAVRLTAFCWQEQILVITILSAHSQI